MSVLSQPWPSQATYWNGHSAASFSALAAPVIPPLDPSDSPFPSPTHDHSAFSALASPPQAPGPRRSTHPQITPQPSPGPEPSSFGGVPPRNARSLDGDGLMQVLDFLSTLLPARFGPARQVRLVIHGGAVMLLNPDLARLAAETAATDARAPQRTTTRDIDYIARSFASEWAGRYGVWDANDRLKQCVFETALQFGLGADWMNSDADVALPMATDPTTGATYDPIHAASIQTPDSLTVYTSPNGLLKLVSVTPFWTVALKMVRYNAADRADICILLRSGTLSRHLHWTPARLELWLLGACWAMGYTNYDAARIKEMRRRMVEVVEEANRWDPEAVADDGRGGTVPLRSNMYPGPGPGYPYAQGYGYQQQGPPAYAYPGGGGAAPFRSHSPPSSSPSPFVLGPAWTPPPPPPKKKKKKTKRAATTTDLTAWPTQWTPPTAHHHQQQQQQWDPESPERWNADVAKEKKHGRVMSFLAFPFLKSSKSQPALKASKHTKSKKQKRRYDESDGTDSDTDTDSDSDDPDWLQRRQMRWASVGAGVGANTGMGVGAGMGGAEMHGAFQYSVADFMSSGMPPAPSPGPAPMSAAQGHVLPGWNVPGAQQSRSPPPWMYARSPPPQQAWAARSPQAQSQTPQPWMYANARQSQAQSPRPWVYASARSPQPQQAWPYAGAPQGPGPGAGGGAEMDRVAAGMNALGLYGV